MRKWTRHSIPDAVRRSLELRPGERVLAAVEDADGRWCAGTDRALYLPGEGEPYRIAWENVDRAAWDKEAESLVVDEVADFGEQEPRHVVGLSDPGRLLELVRERVTASVLARRPVAVDGQVRKRVTAVARRSPTRTGDITFAYVLDDGLDPGDPAVLEAAAEGMATVRDDIGV